MSQEEFVSDQPRSENKSYSRYEHINTLSEQLESYVNSLPGGSKPVKRPLGFIRSKVVGQPVFVKTLIDPGNLFGSLISEELAQKLNMVIIPDSRQVGTAAQGGTVTVLGRGEKLCLDLECSSRSICFTPYVVRDLAHSINLGQDVLREYNCSLVFSKDKVILSFGSAHLDLMNRSDTLLQGSKDPRFALALRVPNLTESAEIVEITDNNSNIRTISETHYNVKIEKKIRIAPGSSGSIILKTKLKSPLVYFEPKNDIPDLNNNELLFMKGFYNNQDGLLKVCLMNLSKSVQTVGSGLTVGKVYAASGPPVHPDVQPVQREVQSCSGSGSPRSPRVQTLDHEAVEDLEETDREERRKYLTTELELDKIVLLNEQEKEELLEIFLDNFDAVSISGEDFGNSNLVQFNIQLLPDTLPHRAKCRPLNPFQEVDLRRQLDEWLTSDIIEPSCSDWAAALVPCKKKGSDKLRWTLDYRILNQMTVKDAFPLPNIDTNIDKLMGAQIFSSLDSAGAYHAINIDPNSRDYTTFVSLYGTFRFKRMPFGLSNSPAAYCRLVQKALEKLPIGFTLAYLDDILVYSKNVKDHFKQLRQVVELHAQVGMKLNLRKCKLFRATVDYLGFQVKPGGVCMIPDYVQKILDWPLPVSGKEMQSFLGFTNYYRMFIPKYSDLTCCLNKYRNLPIFELGETEETAISLLKKAFTAAPVRAYPDYYSEEPFILSIDYSKCALAGVLSQVQNGAERFIGAFSKTCNKAESNYSAHKGEACSLIYSLRKFEHLLRAKKFVIRTDSNNLLYMDTMKEKRGVWARWNIYLSSFNYEMKHRPGKDNVCADALSRTNIPTETDSESEEKEPLMDVDDIYNMEETPLVKDKISREEWILRSRTDYDISLTKSFIMDKVKPTMQERRRLPRLVNQLLNRFEQLSVDEELLWYTAPLQNGRISEARICVPSVLQDRVVLAAHCTGTAHAGITETYEKLKKHCYFPGMWDKCRFMINNCVSCLQKTNRLGQNKSTIHRELLSYPMQRVYIDTVGPLSPCRHQGVVYRHIFTLLDGFTRFLTAIPVPDIESKTLLAAFREKFIFQFGLPEVIHCDRGTSFTSHVFTLSMEQLGIVLTHTPAYSPEGNRVERSHQSLGKLLRADDSVEPGAWVVKLAGLLFGHNAATCTQTGVSPFYAMFGRNPRLPLDVMFPIPQVVPVLPWTDFITNLSGRFAEITRNMSRVEAAQFGFNNELKSPRTTSDLMLGDTVYYFSPKSVQNLSRKLTCRWTGPWTIIRVITDSLSAIIPLGVWMLERNRYKEVIALNSRLRRMSPSASIPATIEDGDEVVSDVESEDGLVMVHPPGPTYNINSSSDSDDVDNDVPTETPSHPPVTAQQETLRGVSPEPQNQEEPRNPETLVSPPPRETTWWNSKEPPPTEDWVIRRPPLELRRLGVPIESPTRPRYAAETAARLIAQQLVRRRRNRQAVLD